jgi:peptidoglycan/LPS O-acetylase OafA/YrhL
MGIIRFLLALSVVIEHSRQVFGFELVGGQIAVQAFYIISGFYMTLILNEKYIDKNNSYKLFISNRLLKLYPIYWTVLLLTIFASIGITLYSSGQNMGKLQAYYEYASIMDLKSLFFLILTNITVVFQDTIMFLGLDTASGDLFFTTDFRQTTPPLYSFLIIHQAWTIGIEITFYLIAPFLVRRKLPFILTLLILSALLRFVLYTNGLQHDPWTYRFFPTELFFFLLGTIAYRIYKKVDSWNLKKSYLMVTYISVLLFTFSYSWISLPFKMYIYFLAFFVSVPFIFILSKRWTKDRYMGELSYPIYISHMLVLMASKSAFSSEKDGVGILVIIASVLFSVLLHEAIAKRIERIRQTRLKPAVNPAVESEAPTMTVPCPSTYRARIRRITGL